MEPLWLNQLYTLASRYNISLVGLSELEMLGGLYQHLSSNACREEEGGIKQKPALRENINDNQ